MKNILLSLMILALLFSPILVTATDVDADTSKPDNRQPIGPYPLRPSNREIGPNNHDIDWGPKDEYLTPDGNIPETQPIDKSSLPPS